MADHTVKSFDADLSGLDCRIAEMGGLAERNLSKAFDALYQSDPEAAHMVIEADNEIDRLEKEIEEKVVEIIAKRQPMADDLRHIMAALKIANELERIGDLAKNIAKRALTIAGEPIPNALKSGLKNMVDLALAQLKQVLDTQTEKNADLALEVWRNDEQIDAMYNSIFRELLTYMMEDPRNIGLCTHLLFGAKNLERIGDHTTNIAETIYFWVNGYNIAEDRPKRDTTPSTMVTHD
jgi:phosphate transport system protein